MSRRSVRPQQSNTLNDSSHSPLLSQQVKFLKSGALPPIAMVSQPLCGQSELIEGGEGEVRLKL